MRKLETFVTKYGPEVGPRYFHLLQSQAAYASAAARLRRKVDVLEGRTPPPPRPEPAALPLFPEPATAVPCPIADVAAVG